MVRLLADQLVDLELAESISHVAVHKRLKKTGVRLHKAARPSSTLCGFVRMTGVEPMRA